MMPRRLLPALLPVVFAASSTLGAGPAVACQIQPDRARTVARVIDGATVVLDDGMTIRLASVLAPTSEDADAERGLWQPELEARAALERLVGSQSVGVAIAGKVDRYGRLPAHLMLIGREPVPVWIQSYLVENGYVRVAPAVEGDPCGRRLLLDERGARTRLLGLWRNAVYRPVDADDVRTLLRRRDTYQIVRGRVLAATLVRGQILLNFGSDWRDDFTVSVSATVRQALNVKGIDAGALSGRFVEARGWIERRNGPMIALRQADELVVLTPEEAAAPR
jgi:endonuclease YncB( thermonuclease family)